MHMHRRSRIPAITISSILIVNGGFKCLRKEVTKQRRELIKEGICGKLPVKELVAINVSISVITEVDGIGNVDYRCSKKIGRGLDILDVSVTENLE